MNPEQEKLYNEILSKNIFNELQLVQIRRGLISNIDVSLYANLNLPGSKWKKYVWV